MKLLVLPFEYFATNELYIENRKFNNFLLRGMPRAVATKFDVNRNISFFVNTYHDRKIIGDNIQVTFLDNEFSTALLALSADRIESNGEFMIIEGYKRDLNNGNFNNEEIKKWEYRFNKMRVKLDKEIKKIEKRNIHFSRKYSI